MHVCTVLVQLQARNGAPRLATQPRTPAARINVPQHRYISGGTLPLTSGAFCVFSFFPPHAHIWNLVPFQCFVYIKEVALNSKLFIGLLLCRPSSPACCNNIILVAGKGHVPECTATKTLLRTAVFQASVAFHLLWESNPSAMERRIKEGPRLHSGP